MDIMHKKNTVYYLAVPMVDSATPSDFKTGETVADTAYYKDGAGAWTSLSITDTFTEIGSTGIYEIDLTAAELNHDQVVIKLTSSGTADSFVAFTLFDNDVDDLATATNLATAQTDLDTITGADGVNLLSATQASIDAIETDTNSLNDTKVPQTLNLTASGNIGIDWANVENPTTAVDLSGTDIQLCDTVTTNTDMRGTDSAGTAANLATVDTVVDAIKAVTDVLPDSGALTSLATAANLATVDTVVDAIKVVTDALPDSGALTSLATAANLTTVDTVVDAIKAKTDDMTFTVANQLDANIQSINDTTITGDGSLGTEFGV